MDTARVLDPRVLRRLEADLADAAALRTFLSCYTDLLPVRIQRIQRALLTCDRGALNHAVRSLQASSLMIGARALADRIEAVMQLRVHNATSRQSAPCDDERPERDERDELDELDELVRELQQLAQQTADLLQEFMNRSTRPCDQP